MLTVLISDCRVSIVGKFLFTHGHWNIFAIYLFRPQKWWWWFQSKLVESKILNIQMNKIRCVFATDTGLTGWGIKKVLALNVAIAKVNMIFPSNFFHSFGTFKCWSGHMYMTNWPPSFFLLFSINKCYLDAWFKIRRSTAYQSLIQFEFIWPGACLGN